MVDVIEGLQEYLADDVDADEDENEDGGAGGSDEEVDDEDDEAANARMFPPPAPPKKPAQPPQPKASVGGAHSDNAALTALIPKPRTNRSASLLPEF